MDEDGPSVAAEAGKLIRFPQSRVSPSSVAPARDLGLGEMARTLGLPVRQLTGHWCSRCQGIWYGYLLEVSCPACANRHG